MPEFVRVKDRTTGHEYSTRNPHPDKVDVLEDEPAVDRKGRPLAPTTATPTQTTDANPVPAHSGEDFEPADNLEGGLDDDR